MKNTDAGCLPIIIVSICFCVVFLGYFIDLPIWLIYGVGIVLFFSLFILTASSVNRTFSQLEGKTLLPKITMLCLKWFVAIIFLFNFKESQYKLAGKTLLVQTQDREHKKVYASILQKLALGISHLLTGYVQFIQTTNPFHSPSQNACYLITGIAIIMSAMWQFISIATTPMPGPQIAEHGVIDLLGVFHPWEDVENFAWQAYAKRLVVKLKGKNLQKIAFENIDQRIQTIILPYLKQSVRNC